MATQEEIIEAHLCDPIPQIEIYRAAVAIFAAAMINSNHSVADEIGWAVAHARELAKEVKGE
jgi:hypothetical protein